MQPLTIVTILLALSGSFALPTKDLHPDTGLTIEELAEKYGYPMEVHTIQTEDGYLIDIHRIKHGRDNADLEDRPAVLMMHCLMCSAAVWVMYGPERALGFMLADQGYDVWMPNARGTTFSRKHVTLDPDVDKADFWWFSWHEIGYYDVPASVDYIIEQTGQEKIFYVGHSQGTTSLFVMTSTRPEYNDKLRLAVSLAPSAYMENMTDELYLFLSQFLDDLELLFYYIGWYEFVPHYDFAEGLAEFCRNEGREFCDNIFFILSQGSEQIDENMLPVFATHLPAGASVRQFVHYGQGIQSGFFRRYDHGLIGNLNEYGQATPPVYETGRISAPMAFFYSENDSRCNVVDVERLASEVQDMALLHLVEDPLFTHTDFLFSKFVVEMVYRHVIDIMSQF